MPRPGGSMAFPVQFGYNLEFDPMQPPAAIVPPVPAVHLEREDYNNLKKVISKLNCLNESLHGRSLEHTLIQGTALAEILEIANKVYLP